MSKPPFLHGDNVVLAELDQDRGAATLARHALSKARQSAAAPTPQPDIACYWRVEIMLHGGHTVTRDVATEPNVRELLLAGWYEKLPNGDVFAVAYDAIATIAVRKLQGIPPSGVIGSLQ